MTGVGLDLALITCLVAINAILSGSEMAFVSLREGQLRRMADTGGRSERAAQLAREPNSYLGAVQLGITTAGFFAAAAAAVSISEPVADLLEPLGQYASATAFALVTTVVVFISLVFGELVPKRLAMQRAERWSVAVAAPLSMFIRATRPAVKMLSLSTDALVRLVGGDPLRRRAAISAEEIVDLVEAQPSLTATQRQIMSGAVEIADRPLRAVLVPRPRVVHVEADVSAEDALAELLASGHSRALVVRQRIDDPIGQIHIRDIIEPGSAVRDRTTPVIAMPETLCVLDALRQLQASRTEFAVVIDEHGGTAGIVTVEDLVEELIGEMFDETDDDLLSVHHGRDGSMLLPGSFPIHDLPDIGIAPPLGPYDTVAGAILDRLGHVPEVGERTVIDNHDFEVVSVEKRSIASVRVTPADPDPKASRA